jgi:hypothetical protein
MGRRQGSWPRLCRERARPCLVGPEPSATRRVTGRGRHRGRLGEPSVDRGPGQVSQAYPAGRRLRRLASPPQETDRMNDSPELQA